MWSRARPTSADVSRFLDEERSLTFTYPEVGHTRDGTAPAGYAFDRNRERCATDFATARARLRAWEMFPAWTAIEPKVPLEVGETLGVLVHALGVWWLNAARIVYVIDEPARFGFAYGTLPGHAECGEERFVVEQLPDGVWYDLRAFSKPRYWAARLGYPITRSLQQRFARDSRARMSRSSSRAAR